MVTRPITASTKESQPRGPARAGKRDGSIGPDQQVTNKERTKDQRERAVMRTCSCGWQRVTTYRGLRIHQGRMKCQDRMQRTRTAIAGQTNEDRGRVANHRPQDFTSGASAPGTGASPGEPRPDTGVQHPTETPNLEPVESIPPEEEVTTSQRVKEVGFVKKEKIKWPKANNRAAWEELDSDLSNVLEQGLKGDIDRKLNSVGEMVYNFCSEKFGTLAVGERQPSSNNRFGRREREILQLVRRRRQLRKLWRKASPEEKVGLQVLWEEVRTRLKSLRRAERLRKKRKRKQKQRAAFFKNSYKFARGLLEEKKGGSLSVGREELEAHLEETYTDPERHKPLGPPGYIPRPAQPSVPMDISPPKWSEITTAIRRARASAAPGPNGVPYRVYKMCPKTLYILWKLMRVAWRKQCVPLAWRRAGGVLIPKEKVSSSIKQFRNISLLNVEGKLFFTVLAKRLPSYLISNNLIDTEIQKAGIPGFPGCTEHASTIWNQIQLARSRKEDLHVVWLDLANAYGSIPHKVIQYALEFFWVPKEVKQMVHNYFSDFKLSISTRSYTTGWQKVEKGIAMGCSISPLLFIMGFEVLLVGAKQVVGGVKAPTGERMPALRAFMDDVTSILRTAPCTKRLLQRLEELTGWAVDLIDRKANSYFRRWLGVPRCLSTVALFGRNKLNLPLTSIAEEFKLDKVRLSLELEGSQDASVRAANRGVNTGRKWSVKDTIEKAVSRLKHKDLVGAVQVGRTGLGWGESTQRWRSANPRERRQLVTQEVRRMEEEGRMVTAVGQSQQGAWLNWDGVVERRLTCQVEFLSESSVWRPPHPSNEESCQLCGVAQADLKHILSGCKTALQQGRYTWRHNKVLRQLAVKLEEVRNESSRTSSSFQSIQFVKEGQKPRSTAVTGTVNLGSSILCRGKWEMRADLDRQLHFPSTICETSLRPDLVLWSEDQKAALIIELTIPWEENVQAAFERKKLKYDDLVQQCKQKGWQTRLYPVEVGVRGFVGASFMRLCRDFNIRGKAQTQLTRQVSEEAERSSFVLWLRRKDKAWKDVLGRTGRNVEEGRRLTDETALQTLGTFRGAEKHAKLSSS
ncbi:hypothetical protein Bbelb_370120 [Branchiostoma belcheri]|nr:hypothetical protein Bbelb_370120 [Branchiostoma belcheri]